MGFELTPAVRLEVTPPDSRRRSKRVQARQGPLYLSAIDKARVTQGYAQIEETPVKAKSRAKKQTDPAKLTYLHNLNPLLATQASLVVAMAGVTIDQHLQDRIDTVLVTPESLTPTCV